MAVVACINCDWPVIRAVTCDVVESEGWTAGLTDRRCVFMMFFIFWVFVCWRFHSYLWFHLFQNRLSWCLKPQMNDVVSNLSISELVSSWKLLRIAQRTMWTLPPSAGFLSRQVGKGNTDMVTGSVFSINLCTFWGFIVFHRNNIIIPTAKTSADRNAKT